MKTQKQASSMNMAIAGLHRFTIQLVALLLAIANLMALCLSALSVVAGVLTVTIIQFPAAYALWIVAGIIGPLLSLLVESGTLNRLIRVRLMNREIAETKSKMEASAENLLASVQLPDPNQPNYPQAMKQYRKTCATIEADAHKRYNRATREQRKTKRLALLMAFACAGASAFAGGIFYHIILAGLGQVWDMAASVVFPLVVTGTFISTELNKDEQEATIREGFGGGALAETAIREETKLQAFKAVSSKAIAYLDKPEAEKDIDAGTRILVQDILAELNEEARQRTRQRQANETPIGHAVVSEEATGKEIKELSAEIESLKMLLPPAQDRDTDKLTSVSQPEQEPDTCANRTGQQALGNASPSGENQPPTSDEGNTTQPQETPYPTRQDTTRKATTAEVQDKTPLHLLRTSDTTNETEGQDTTGQPDATTARILAYKKGHPEATQTEIAEAVNVSVKTVQRRLAAVKTA